LHLVRAICALCATLVAAGVASAAEIEYAVVHRALGAAREIAAYPRLVAVQRIESKRAGIPPRAIRIAIRARAGEIPVPVAADGTVRLPIDDALLAENPIVETNQPPGSLTLTVSVELPRPAAPLLGCAEVEAALVEADALLASQRSRSRVRGVEFLFARGAGGVTLRGEGERTLVPDRHGRVIVMRDPDLRERYREIELSAPPLRILPFLEQ
jgi:hypothetical protein